MKPRLLSMALAMVCLSPALAQTTPPLAPAQPEDRDAGSEALESVIVTGTRERAYREVVAPTANKSDTPIKETPFSIQTVTRELIADRGVTSFGEAVRTVPGLTPQVGLLGSNDRFRLRGFATPSNLKNGLRRSVFIPIDELANIEQIEVLKGPASALYGRFEPGGVVNLITKKPLSTQRTALELSAGSFHFRRATLDVTGPISETLGYRINAAWQETDSFRDFADSNTRFLSPVVAWRPSPQTEVVVELEYLKRDQGPDRGFGNSPLFLQVPITRNYGEPGLRVNNESMLGSVVVNHALSEAWSLKVAAQATQGRLDGRYVSYGFPAVSGVDTPDPQVNRAGTIVFDRERDHTVQVELSGRARLLGLSHRPLFGAELGRTEEDSNFDRATLGSISLFNPVYGQQFGDVTPTSYNAFNKSTAFYAQDEMQLGERWRLLLGLRHDRARYRAEDSFIQGGTPGEGRASKTSPRAGLTFTPVPAVSLYTSWARSFAVDVFSRLSSGDMPKPIRAEQFELGSKFDLFDGRFTPTLAWFDITRRNGTVADPNDPTFTFSIQTGEQRSRGWELDLPVIVNRQWRMLGSYTRLDARFTEDPSLQGKRMANAPETNASIWTTYDFAGAWAGFSVGTGLHYVGEREANNANTFQLPSYTRWDANLAYRFGAAQRWRAQLNVQNLTDKRYHDSGGSFVPTYPGAPRTVNLALGVSL